MKSTQIPLGCVNVKQESGMVLFVLGQHGNHQPFFFIKMKNKNLASLLLFLSRWASGRADLNFRM